MQQTSGLHHLPTIDDFVKAMQDIRTALEESGIAPTFATLRPSLQRFAAEQRERFLAGATNSFDLERRQREWDRAQFSGLFGHQ